MVPGPLCTPPEFILEVLKLTTNETRQGRAERMLVEEEAGLATEAALSASWALSLLGERALVSTLWASCSSASRSGVAAWGCWVGPTHDGGCIERELPPALPFGLGTPSTPDPSTSCCSREERGHSQGRRPETGTEPSLLEPRPKRFSSQVRGPDPRILS